MEGVFGLLEGIDEWYHEDIGDAIKVLRVYTNAYSLLQKEKLLDASLANPPRSETPDHKTPPESPGSHKTGFVSGLSVSSSASKLPRCTSPDECVSEETNSIRGPSSTDSHFSDEEDNARYLEWVATGGLLKLFTSSRWKPVQTNPLGGEEPAVTTASGQRPTPEDSSGDEQVEGEESEEDDATGSEEELHKIVSSSDDAGTRIRRRQQRPHFVVTSSSDDEEPSSTTEDTAGTLSYFQGDNMKRGLVAVMPTQKKRDVSPNVQVPVVSGGSGSVPTERLYNFRSSTEQNRAVRATEQLRGSRGFNFETKRNFSEQEKRSEEKKKRRKSAKRGKTEDREEEEEKEEGNDKTPGPTRHLKRRSDRRDDEDDEDHGPPPHRSLPLCA